MLVHDHCRDIVAYKRKLVNKYLLWGSEGLIVSTYTGLKQTDQKIVEHYPQKHLMELAALF